MPFILGCGGYTITTRFTSFCPKGKKANLSTQLKVRRFVGGIWYYFIRYLSCAGALKVTYQGFEKLGRPGQLVVVNHPSLLDVVLILVKAPST